MFENSIDAYNKYVDKKCEEVMKKNKSLATRDYLSLDRVFNKELGGFVSAKPLNKETFKNIIKNSYKYLGEKSVTEPQLEDLWKKGFDSFTIDEFMEYIDIVQSGSFATIGEAFNSFKKELDNRTATASMTMSSPSVEITEDLSVDFGQGGQYEQVYPPVGSEAEYGFAPSGRTQEMSDTMRAQQERLRTSSEASIGGRPVPQSSILTGMRGRPANIDIGSAPIFTPPTIMQIPSGGSSVS
tara:strand:- start:156 stop:878 length:723 start_codon:yes stop_codon:yes gene_type:complete